MGGKKGDFLDDSYLKAPETKGMMSLRGVLGVGVSAMGRGKAWERHGEKGLCSLQLNGHVCRQHRERSRCLVFFNTMFIFLGKALSGLTFFSLSYFCL